MSYTVVIYMADGSEREWDTFATDLEAIRAAEKRMAYFRVDGPAGTVKDRPR